MKKIGLVLLTLVLMVAFAGSAYAEIKLGVLAKRGNKRATEKWGATADYLSSKLGEKVTLIPLKFTAIEPIVKSGKIDLLLANPSFFVEMEKKYGARALTTLINMREGKALNEFGAVILSRADSNIKTLADVKGKKFMCVKYSGFGGAQMAWRLFLDNGIDPKKDFAAFTEGRKHDNVVMAVKKGVMDAGTVRTDTLERMAGTGAINMADFHIIHEIKDDFPHVRSTRLYPEWPMAALKHFDVGKGKKVAAALQALPRDHQAIKNARMAGWSSVADYSPVVDCLKVIKYGAFAN